MTNEEAIKNIVAYVYYAEDIPEEVGKAFDVAIKALKEQKDRYGEGYADGFSDGSAGILLRLTEMHKAERQEGGADMRGDDNG